jgi:PAS domain S-box-containing protein
MKQNRRRQRPFIRQRHSKSELQAECEFITAVLDTIDTLIVVFDRDGRIVRFNHACETLTGYTVDEVAERPFWETLIAPAEQAAAQSEFARLLDGPFPRKTERCWLTRNGRRRTIAWSNNAYRDDSGDIAYLISAGTDVSEQRQAASLLNASESLQRVTTALLQHRTTVDDVMAIVCAEARRLTCAEGSAVLLLEDETGLQVRSSSGSPLPIFGRLSVDEAFAGQVIRQKEPLLLDDPQSRIHAYDRNPAIHSLLAVPLCVDETALGVLDVVNKPGGFSESDVRMMKLFADQAAVSIEHAQLHRRAEKLAVLEERQRLARELHDSVTQAIYSVTLYADAARMALAAGKQEVALAHLQELRSMAREAMLDMRLLIFELHPPVLEKEGLATAVQTRLETVEARSGLQSTFLVEGEEQRLPLFIEEDLYRIVQEVLNNAVKHARAQQVTVHLLFAEHHFELEICDDGIGFDPDAARRGGGMGLRNIQERARRIGGVLTVDSRPEKGTALKIEVDF